MTIQVYVVAPSNFTSNVWHSKDELLFRHVSIWVNVIAQSHLSYNVRPSLDEFSLIHEYIWVNVIAPSYMTKCWTFIVCALLQKCVLWVNVVAPSYMTKNPEHPMYDFFFRHKSIQVNVVAPSYLTKNAGHSLDALFLDILGQTKRYFPDWETNE